MFDFVEAVENSLWISSPEYGGWLLKGSSNWLIKKTSILRDHSWVRKWASLYGTELLCLEMDPTLENMKVNSKVLRTKISGSTSIESDEVDPLQFVIKFNLEHFPDWVFRADSVEEKNNWIIKLSQVRAIAAWFEEFDRVKVLGVGGQGNVYELVRRQTGERFAMKETVMKNEKQKRAAIAEAVFLKQIAETIRHPNIMPIKKIFQVGSRFYLAFPLCTGGELFDAIVDRGHFSEHDAAVIIHDLISALHALHAHDILHLDIKPENILFANKDIDSRILLTDFGLSKAEESKFKLSLEDREIFQKTFQENLEIFLENGDLGDNLVFPGTNGYLSPEVIATGFFSKAADVFASGVVLYTLLCGYAPFTGRSKRQLYLKTLKGYYNMEGPEWENVSEQAKDLLKKMLVIDPFDRITTEEILKHPWIVAAGSFNKVQRSPEHLSAAPPENRFLSSRSENQHSGANKAHALSQLANHVQDLKTEKMAATMTKLLSFQGHQVGHSHLARKYLIQFHQDEPVLNERKDFDQIPVKNLTLLIRNEMRHAISSAIFGSICESKDKIAIEEFSIIRKKFLSSFANAPSPTSVAGSNTNQINFNVGEILLANLMDRDHDGFITIEDIYNFQVHLMRKNEVYLQAVFRLYLEALWYPGKNLNYLNTVQHMNLKVRASESSVSPREGRILIGMSNLLGSFSGKLRIVTVKEEEEGKADVVEPPKYITAKNVAAVFERFGYDPKSGETAFHILCEALERVRLGSGFMEDVQKGGEEIIVEVEKNFNLRNVRGHRLDVNDFVRACRMDDVLVQVLYRQQHQKLHDLIEKAKRRFIEEKEKQAKIPLEERKELLLETIVYDVLHQACR
eukprot:gene193-201_t